jgi:hypothetical protein
LKKRWVLGKRLKCFLAKLERQLGGADVSDATMSATVEHIAPGPNSGVHLSLQKTHAILAGLALLDVVVSADPGDEAILAGGLMAS